MLDPTCAFHGLKASEHEYGRCLYCCFCFKTLTPDECHTDNEGVKWDVCEDCAALEEQAAEKLDN